MSAPIEEQPLSVTHDPRFTHWVQPAKEGGHTGQGQYWFTNESDARAFRDSLQATLKNKWRYQVFTWNPLRDDPTQPKGIAL